jgi:hypothetical protein
MLISHLGSVMLAVCLTRPQYVLRSYCDSGSSLLPGIEADMLSSLSLTGRLFAVVNVHGRRWKTGVSNVVWLTRRKKSDANHVKELPRLRVCSITKRSWVRIPSGEAIASPASFNLRTCPISVVDKRCSR